MDPKLEAFVTALDDFAAAAAALAERWEMASDGADVPVEGYPFPDSFDEVAYAIRRWSEATRESLSARSRGRAE
jgi:hypothetical protein